MFTAFDMYVACKIRTQKQKKLAKELNPKIISRTCKNNIIKENLPESLEFLKPHM